MSMVTRLFAIFLILVIAALNADAKVIYIDQLPAESGSGWSGVDGETYTGAPGVGVGYSTLEYGFAAVVTGDKIYLRGGTYQENFGDTYNAMPLPSTVDGDSWEEGHYQLIASYPGEWAILDANQQKICVTGFYGLGETGGGADARDFNYWIIERLEITGAYYSGSDDVVAGIAINNGPAIIRYCYIHDNLTDDSFGENPAGIRGYFGENVQIKYNHFYNNGAPGTAGISNAAHVLFFSDYNFDRNNFDINGLSRHSYEIAYNYADTAHSAFKDKAGQYLGSSVDDYTYEGLAPRIHHNVIKNVSASAITVDTDFIQIYNNIAEGIIQSTWNRSANNGAIMSNMTIYNNTVISAPIAFHLGYTESWPSFEGRYGVFNNIVSGWGLSGYDASISILPRQCAGGTVCSLAAQNEAVYSWTGTEVNHNLIYNPQSVYHFSPPHTSDAYTYDFQTVAELNASHGWENYVSSDAGLFNGGAGYLEYTTNSSFALSGGTISNSGDGGSHPYLSETLPSYIGAENPADNAWVEGVYNLTVSYLQSVDTTTNPDPSWIEGVVPGTTRYYLDIDGDGYSPGAYQDAESDPGATWYTEAELISIILIDCDDTNAAINPGATEVCGDGIDNNCSGADATCGLVRAIQTTGTVQTIQTTGTVQVVN